MTDTPAYLTTREVAGLLRVKERKVYDMAASGEIPHRRITGKLLFPQAELQAWLDGTPAQDRPAVIAGSHDPLLDWAVRESGAGLATLWDGSRFGLARFAEGDAALTGLHLPQDDGWNLQAVADLGVSDAVLIAWATRQRGLVLSRDCKMSVTTPEGLKGLRVVRRQPGAGASELLEHLLQQAGMSDDDILPGGDLARTEADAAAAVAAGEADAALGIAAMAQRFNLPFVALLDERYDLLINRRAYFTDPVQRLLTFAASPACAEKAKFMGGYDVTGLGTVRWLSP